MNLLHVTTSDIGHGAGMAAYGLHESLRVAGHHSEMAVMDKVSEHPNVFEISRPNRVGLFRKKRRRFANRREMYFNRFGPQNLVSSDAPSFARSAIVSRADIVNLHVLHGSARHFPFSLPMTMSRRKPTVWTLHDMWAFTGHCIYSYDCQKWRTGCGNCPALDLPLELQRDTSALSVRLKKWSYARSNFVVVAPSIWLAELARQAPAFESIEIHHIPYGVDSSIFVAGNMQSLRADLRLSPDRPVIAAIAPNFDDKRKGRIQLKETLGRVCVERNDITLLTIGKGDVGPRIRESMNVVSLGYLDDRRELARAFAASDLTIFPTLADNLPQTVLESMSCGTPVVSFRVGGLPDMIDHMKNGYLASELDTNDLANGIQTLLSDKQRLKEMRAACRDKMIKCFSPELQASRYLSIYEQMISKRDGGQ